MNQHKTPHANPPPKTPHPNPPPGVPGGGDRKIFSQCAPWPMWKIILAYVLMALLSLAAIVVVDVKVHRTAVMPRTEHPSQ